MRYIKTKLDINKQNYTKMECMQNDDISLEVTLLENGVAYDLKNTTIVLNWLKADNKFVIISDNSIVINNNIVTIKLLRDCTRAIGESKFELNITDNSSKQISTFPLSVDVTGSVLGAGEASKNVVTVVEELKEMIELAKKQDNKKYTITTPMWAIINPTTLEYSYVLEHDLNSRNLHITIFEESHLGTIGAEIIDEAHVKFTSNTNNITDIILSSGYYGGYTSAKTEKDITNIFNQLSNLDCGTW